MQASCWSVDDLIPHRAPMALIDEVVAFDREACTLTAAFSARREWSESWAAIEYMAQASAALAGAMDMSDGCSDGPRPGFLLGTRKLELSLPRFEPGRRYLVAVTRLFADAESGSFECEIRDGETVVARATLSAYLPPDASAFLASRRA